MSELEAAAWQALESRLRPFVARRVPCNADVDDVMQDVFVRMQRGLSDLNDSERLGAWMFRVARSAIVDHHRRAARHPQVDAEADELPADEAEQTTAEQELASYMAAFVAMLPPMYREPLTLTELEGLSQKDGAAMLGLSLPAMKSRVQRGRAMLRDMLEACCAITLDARGRVMACEPRPDGKIPNCRC